MLHYHLLQVPLGARILIRYRGHTDMCSRGSRIPWCQSPGIVPSAAADSFRHRQSSAAEASLTCLGRACPWTRSSAGRPPWLSGQRPCPAAGGGHAYIVRPSRRLVSRGRLGGTASLRVRRAETHPARRGRRVRGSPSFSSRWAARSRTRERAEAAVRSPAWGLGERRGRMTCM